MPDCLPACVCHTIPTMAVIQRHFDRRRYASAPLPAILRQGTPSVGPDTDRTKLSTLPGLARLRCIPDPALTVAGDSQHAL